MMPRPCASTRSRSSGSSSGSPKNVSPPSASRLTSARRITPAVVVDTAPSAFSSGLPSSLVRCVITARRSLRSSSGSALLIGPVEDQPERGLLGGVEPQHLRQQDRPEAGDGGAHRHRRCPRCPATGTRPGRPSAPTCRRCPSARSVILSPASPGRDSPDRSPLTSAISTGTPAAESCSAITCSDFVLPVPVAPATRPCRLSVASGIRTCAVGSATPSTTTVPSSSACAFDGVTGGDLLRGGGCRFGGHVRDHLGAASRPDATWHRPGWVWAAACRAWAYCERCA